MLIGVTHAQQPGLMLTDGSALRYAGLTFLGFLCLVATIAGSLFTTASDALVSPQLKFGDWEKTVLQVNAQSSYGNVVFARDNCATPISAAADDDSGNSCLDVTFSGTCRSP
jgi:hypothetical protein